MSNALRYAMQAQLCGPNVVLCASVSANGRLSCQSGDGADVAERSRPRFRTGVRIAASRGRGDA
jgi:hypothetical protein